MNPRVPFLAIATRIVSRGKIWLNYERLTRAALRHQESACWVVHYASTVGVNVLNAQRKCTAYNATQRAWQNTVNSCRVCNAQCAWSTLHGISVNLTRLAFYVMIIGPGCVHGPMHTHTQLLGDDDDYNNYNGDHVFIAIIRNNLSFLCHPSFLSMEFQTSIVRRQNWYCHCTMQVKVFLKLCWALATGIINHHPPERNMLSIFGQSSPTSWSGRS